MISLDAWMMFLKSSSSIIGLPLIVAGLGLMLFGWRMWKICVMFAFAGVGVCIGAYIVGPSANQWKLSIALGGFLGVMSYWPVRQAVAALGGMIAAGIVMVTLGALGIHGMPQWLAGATLLTVGTAYGALHRQRVVILVTAFMGAVLLLSGFTALVMASPSTYGIIGRTVTGSAIALPFLLMVPTVVSSFYQIAEVRRLQVEL